jgi:hypothetical protein
MSKNVRKVVINPTEKISVESSSEVNSSSKVVVDEKALEVVFQTIQTQTKINKDKQIVQKTKIYELEQMNNYLKACAEKFHNENTILKTQQTSMKNKGVISKDTYQMLSDVESSTRNQEKEINDIVETNKMKVDKDFLEYQKKLFGPI